MVMTLTDPSIDGPQLTRLLVRACSEAPACARGEAESLLGVALIEDDLRAHALSNTESLDDAARLLEDKTLTPLKWVKARWKPILDAAGKAASPTEQKTFGAARKKLKL
jgi:hypothetical protein